MPLIFAPEGRTLKIVKVISDSRTRKHLDSLGLGEGGSISLLSGGAGGVVIRIKQGRMALDADLAAGIIVSLSDE